MPVIASRAGRTTVLAVAAFLVAAAAPALAATSPGADHVLPIASVGSGAHRVCGPAHPGYRTCFAIALPPAHTATPVRTSTPGTATPSTTTTSAFPLHGPAGGLTPYALQTAYGVDAGAATNQMVAVVDAYDDPKIWWELNAFDKKYGLAPETTDSFSRVDQRGGRTFPSADAGWAVEEALDVEAVRAMCHRCRIRLVEADNSSSANLAYAANRAVAIGATVVSNSYGGPEWAGEASWIRQAYTHPGVVVTASTGDDGWYGWDQSNDGAQAEGGPEVPAAYPDVAAVGGTKLVLNSNGTAYGERVWNRNGQADVYGLRWGPQGASGGGCSHVYPAPSWQTPLHGYELSGCKGYRMVGDIAADADPTTGMDIYTLYGGAGVWETVGGTSLAAPLIAGMWAVAGGAAGAQHPVQRLYDNQRMRRSSYFDVYTGANGFCGASDVMLGKISCSLSLWALANTGDPNNLAFSGGHWAGNLDCGWRLDGQLGTLSDDRQCRAGVGYDGPSGIGAPRSGQVFQSTLPTASLAAITDAADTTPVSVQATGQVVVSGDKLTKCAVSWGDSTADTVACSAGAPVTATHVYAAPGAYSVTFTVTDAYGQTASATQSATVTATS